MSIAINVGAKPVLTLSLVAGGNLPIGTTYYFIGVSKDNRGYNGGCLSPASDQKSITTDAANRSIKVSWGVLTAPFSYIFLKWDTTTMMSGGNYLSDPALSNWTHGYQITPYSGTDITYTDTPPSEAQKGWGYHHLQIAWASTDDIDSKIDTTKGRPEIEFTGTGNTWGDLITAIKGSTAKDCFFYSENSLSLFAFMNSAGGDGLATFTEKSFTFLYTSSYAQEITYDKCNLYFNCAGWIWSRLYGTYRNCQVISWATWREHLGEQDLFEDFKIFGNHYVTYKSLSGVTFTDYGTKGQLYPQASGIVFTGLKFANSVPEVVFRYTVVTGENHQYDNFIFENNGLQNIDWEWSFPAGITATPSTSKVYMKNLSVNRTDGKIITSYPDLGSDYPDFDIQIHAQEEINFKITDKDGNNITGATVKITDAESTEYSDITDGSGEASLTIADYINEYDTLNANGYRSKNTLKSPFILEITKTGYGNYKEIFTNIDTTKEIAMIDAEDLIIESVLETTIEDEEISAVIGG